MISPGQHHQDKLHPSPHSMGKPQSISSITQFYYRLHPNSPAPRPTRELNIKSTPSRPLRSQASSVSLLSPTGSLSSAYSCHSTTHHSIIKSTSISNLQSAIPSHHLHSASMQSIAPTPHCNNSKPNTSSLPRFVQPQLKLKPRATRSNSHLTRPTAGITQVPTNIPPPPSAIFHHPPPPVYHSAIPVTIPQKVSLSYEEKIADFHLSILRGTDYQYSQAHANQIHQIPTQPFFYPQQRPPTPSSTSDLSASHSSASISPPFSLCSARMNSTESPAPIDPTLSSYLSFSSCSEATPPSTHPIHVIVRVRDHAHTTPPSEEFVLFDNQTVTLRIPQTVFNVNQQQLTSHEFRFDKIVYPIAKSSKPNSKLYERCSIETKLLDPFLNGFNSCLIAYGQTGSGKSFTLGSDNNPSNTDGLIPKTLARLFYKLNCQKQTSSPQSKFHYEIFVTFIEIYNDELVDLLSSYNETKSTSSKKAPIKIHENKQDGTIELIGCQKIRVIDSKEVLNHFNQGLNQRSIGSTHSNQTSSRSHAIFTVHLVTSSSQTNDHPPEHVKKTFSKLQFVDLAGSERINKTKNILGSDRFKEGISINAGLHALGNVISALSNQPTSSSDSSSKNANKKKNYVPYRESKLTRLLKDSLGGNSQTVLLSCISQNPQDINESLNTLRYSIRAKKVENNCSKITKVVQTPIVQPTKVPNNKSTIPTINFKKALNSSPLNRRKSSHGNHKSDIKKPMITMNELIRMKSRKSVVISTNQSCLIDSDVHQQKIFIQTYLNQQVHKFIQQSLINGSNRRPSIDAKKRSRHVGAAGTNELIKLLRHNLLRDSDQVPIPTRIPSAIQSLMSDKLRNTHAMLKSSSVTSISSTKELADPCGNFQTPSVPVSLNHHDDQLFNFLVELDALCLTK